MLQAKIAMIDNTGKIIPHHLIHTASAIQTQINRDLAKYWPVSATVEALPTGAQVPLGTWPLYVVDSLPDGEGGYHWQGGSANQPYAEILGGTGWTVSASHEILELLIDPWGNRLQDGLNVQLNGKTQTLGSQMEAYLVEVCDPCEAIHYMIGDVPVSDFITPNFYKVGTTGLQYSMTGAIKKPLEILFGGYISWMTPTNEMQQLLWLDPNKDPEIVNLGPATGKASLKEHVDNHSGGTKRISLGTLRTSSVSGTP